MFDFLLKPKTIQKVDYEDVIYAIQQRERFLIINTLPVDDQHVLIQHTLLYSEEENQINTHLQNYSMDNIHIVIYGKNANDDTAEKKYHQMVALGFRNVYVYGGGLFEWLLLQDIFGDVNFPTTHKTNNFFRFKAPSVLSQLVYKSITS